MDKVTTNIHKPISLPEDIGQHSFTDMEWWYYFAFLNGEHGGKYAAMAAFYQAGELPILKGHYLIFSLIDLKSLSSRSFSFIDRKLAMNFLGINIPLHLVQFPNDKKVINFFGNLIVGKLPSPHQWLFHASIEKDPVRLLYDDSCMVFKNNKDGRFNVTVSSNEIEQALNLILQNLYLLSVEPASQTGYTTIHFLITR